MLNDDNLTDLLVSNDLSQQDKVLLILAFSNGTPLSYSAIQNIAISRGLRKITRWNLPRNLTKAKGLVTKVPDGWKLTGPGRAHIQEKFLSNDSASTKVSALRLRSYLDKISNIDTRNFVEESIQCLESSLHKSAVVMSWIGAMSVLYDYVISDSDRLKNFNDRAKLRLPKWKIAVTKDDLMLMSESEFLDILAYMSILQKNTKERLKMVCLDLRNSCGHPSSIKIAEYTVQAHIEFLILNVYEKF